MFGSDKKDEARLRAYALKTGAFDSKKTAFDYFFIFEGKSADEAEQLASRIAAARGVPDIPAPAKSLIDKAKDLFRQGSDLATENPKITDFVIGLVSGAVSSAFGVKVGADITSSGTESPKYDIDESSEVKDIE